MCSTRAGVACPVRMVASSIFKPSTEARIFSSVVNKTGANHLYYSLYTRVPIGSPATARSMLSGA